MMDITRENRVAGVIDQPDSRFDSANRTSSHLPVEVSVVIPCLNEVDTVASCIRVARKALDENRIDGEIIVADNGSTDGSQELIRESGARLVHIEAPGYGHALMGGIAAARGRYVIMGDADESYDFSEIPNFIAKLREGSELVQGCRLPSGGGRVLPGAMPFSHRWLGNPMFSFLVRKMFKSPVHDTYCGLRGFTKSFYERLDMRCTGMEFATEMIVKGAMLREPTSEVPITLHRDGRRSTTKHLKTVRDGWRTLRFLLVSSPMWLFFMPGLFAVLIGAAGYGLAFPGFRVLGATLDAHTLLFSSLAILLGFQSMLFSAFSTTFAVNEGLIPGSALFRRLEGTFRLEVGLLAGAIAFLAGLGLMALAVWKWSVTGFGELDYPRTMRIVIPGVMVSSLGFQTILASFLLSILGMKRR